MRILGPLLLAFLVLAAPAAGQRRGGSSHSYGGHSSGRSRSYGPRTYHAPKTYHAPRTYQAPKAYHAPKAHRAPRSYSYHAPRAPREPKYYAPGTRDSRGRIKRSPSARADFMRATGYPRGRPGYVIDHKVPLACGGADAPSNMQWQTKAEAKAKDAWERKGCGRR